MKTRTLGRSGIEVSAVGLGCNSLGGRIDREASRQVVHRALDLGITLFDTANSYGNRYGAVGGSERCLGEALGDRRKQVVLATKFGCQSHKHESIPVEGASRGEIMAAAHASLKRLGTDWIDLYQLHHPDPRTPMDETLRALDDLVQQGKVRAIGCSNFSAAQFAHAHTTAAHLGVSGFVTCQSEYSLIAPAIRVDLTPALAARGASLLPCYPLAAGLLTGKYLHGSLPDGSRLATQKRLAECYLTATHRTAAARLEQYGARYGKTLLELAFGWLLTQPVVSSVIAGATSAEQVSANVSAASWCLTPQQMAEIDLLIDAQVTTDTRDSFTATTGELQ